ncbi:MAG TPA: ATP synthase F0 subunit B [Flavobacteriales bacterium]|nr:ATP synthase F0 subunit B [Flavobacteriales bacterium]HCA83981.1 ATP synthase F0 subunit B [Flavobacteriales bacterium]HRE75745.1 F0F1 ATP synthase subunit B [Flavobacteriales bacterium]HRE96789.1 F0F1 ATP synthase subunit B [Flavobacteriales bacterium]HRJ34793.1 F0F1 ATP synthase subunit B [Flavobacteriales bacterium]
MLTVSFGTIIWTSIAFILVLVIMKKLAWKPILETLAKREKDIQEAIDSARLAREEMARLKVSNEELQKKAREERDLILKEARDTREAIVAEAKQKATLEADRILAAARENIKNEKMAAISDLKNQVATLSIEIAEKILRNQLSADDKQKALINNMVEEINLN